jgi:hypothetical protein
MGWLCSSDRNGNNVTIFRWKKKPGIKNSLGREKNICYDNIKMDVNETGSDNEI